MAGRRVLYFPIDSVLPVALADRLGVRKYLAGDRHDRVKTAMLRGCSSQGLIADTNLLLEHGLDDGSSSEAITFALGVSKFDPPPNEIYGGRLLPLPDCLSVYDIENAERRADVVAWLMDRDVAISEKCEG